MKNIIYLLTILLFTISCRNTDLEGPSPSERTRESIVNLRNELTQAPYGWKVVYFPKTDSLLFSDKDQVLEQDPTYPHKFGYGGYYFTMKFNEDGTLSVFSDENENTITNMSTGEFDVRQNTFTQLSFTTPTYLHRLINEDFSGSSDFLYIGKNLEGHLVFRTASYTEPAREYIVFEKLTEPQAMQSNVRKSYENRKIFHDTWNPQITIKKGSRVFFQSDVIVRTEHNNSYFISTQNKRYYLFRVTKRRNPDPNLTTPLESTGLGSGYVGTEYGITFRAGIRYSKSYVFYDFQRVGDRLICELVKVYDPIKREYRLMSKHLAPADAEPTGYIAEIK